MTYCKGAIVGIRQCGGCVEVIVDGERPGSFAIDNCCVPAIVDAEGPDWLGRQVEYEDGGVRFLDVPEIPEELGIDLRAQTTPLLQSPSSVHHI